MRTFKIVVMALLFSTAFTACKKEKDEIIAPQAKELITTDNPAILGIWEGMYTTPTKTSPVYLGFKVKPGGVLELLDMSHQVTGSGKWTLEGAIFKADYTIDALQKSYSVIGTLDAIHIDGVWKDQPYQNSGYWSVNKVQ
jgi:hypothetical protein